MPLGLARNRKKIVTARHKAGFASRKCAPGVGKVWERVPAIVPDRTTLDLDDCIPYRRRCVQVPVLCKSACECACECECRKACGLARAVGGACECAVRVRVRVCCASARASARAGKCAGLRVQSNDGS